MSNRKKDDSKRKTPPHCKITRQFETPIKEMNSDTDIRFCRERLLVIERQIDASMRRIQIIDNEIDRRFEITFRNSLQQEKLLPQQQHQHLLQSQSQPQSQGINF